MKKKKNLNEERPVVEEFYENDEKEIGECNENDEEDERQALEGMNDPDILQLEEEAINDYESENASLESVLIQENGSSEDSVRIYLKEVGRYPLLSIDKEKELADKIANGDENARNDLVNSNLRLVVSIAKKYVGSGLPFNDLISEGNRGLIKATHKYDSNKGFRFSTYATWWIRQSIIRAIADHSKQIRIPVHMVETIHKINRFNRQTKQDIGRSATTKEIAEHMHMSEDKVREIMKICMDPVSLETPVGEEEDSHLGDFIQDDDNSSPQESASIEMLREELRRSLHVLSEREQEVIKMRYGLCEDGKAKTLGEVGAILKITRERVRQIEKHAIRELSRANNSRRLIDFLQS